MEPMPPALEVWDHDHWTTQEVLFNFPFGSEEAEAQGGKVSHPWSCPDGKQQSRENPGMPLVTLLFFFLTSHLTLQQSWGGYVHSILQTEARERWR